MASQSRCARIGRLARFVVCVGISHDNLDGLRLHS